MIAASMIAVPVPSGWVDHVNAILHEKDLKRLRESVRLGPSGADGYDSLVVMSLLDREYQARVALGLESH